MYAGIVLDENRIPRGTDGKCNDRLIFLPFSFLGVREKDFIYMKELENKRLIIEVYQYNDYNMIYKGEPELFKDINLEEFKDLQVTTNDNGYNTHNIILKNDTLKVIIYNIDYFILNIMKNSIYNINKYDFDFLLKLNLITVQYNEDDVKFENKKELYGENYIILDYSAYCDTYLADSPKIATTPEQYTQLTDISKPVTKKSNIGGRTTKLIL